MLSLCPALSTRLSAHFEEEVNYWRKQALTLKTPKQGSFGPHLVNE